jgi:predicted DNA repair protein MutK
MASSLLALLDDIASVLDDVALLTKTAAAKTSAVVGDDLAVNAQQVGGVAADRELPVVWAVAKGSLVNKAILVPAALAVSAWIPWAVTPLLMAGGLFLCYEGMEKVLHRITRDGRDRGATAAATAVAIAATTIDLEAFERSRIKGAIRTDFILSAEIITITLGIVASAAFATRIAVLIGIAIAMTAGVYGLVAAIVKLDDAGLHLARTPGAGGLSRARRALGTCIVGLAPALMRTLAVVGTVAMFLVGGGILAHGIAVVRAVTLQWAAAAGAVHAIGAMLAALTPLAIDLAIGVIAGAAVHAVAALGRRARPGSARARSADRHTT